MRVQPFAIPKNLNESIRIQEHLAPGFYNKLHQHVEIQISYIKEGYGNLIISDSIHTIVPGDIYVIGSNNPHVFKSAEACPHTHMISLFFSQNTIDNVQKYIPEMDTLNDFFSKTETSIKIISRKKSIRNKMNQLLESDKFSRFILFLQIIKKIKQAEIHTLSEFKYHKKITAREGKRMEVIFDYLIINFRNEITLKTISELVFMTPNAFCRFFKQRTNSTFSQFLLQLRVEYACQLLDASKDIPMAEIAEKSGFNSISNFNRQFRTIKKCAPSSYKTKA